MGLHGSFIRAFGIKGVAAFDQGRAGAPGAVRLRSDRPRRQGHPRAAFARPSSAAAGAHRNEIASRIHFSPEHVGQGRAFFRAADKHGLEGIVSKRADSAYAGSRTKAWLKIKSFAVGDFAVLGVEKSATGLPVALLATLGQDPSYVGDAVVTLKAKDRDTFWSSVEKLGTPRSRLGGLTKRKAAWIKEGLVARVRHLKGEDKLRHATIQSVGPKGEAPEEHEPGRHPEDK